MLSIPAYMRIRNYAIDLISKNPSCEEKLLSERELCEVFGVSRTTVRKALKDLVSEGFLVSHHGKGTFTNPKKGVSSPFLKADCYSIGLIWGDGKSVYFNRHPWTMINASAEVVVNNGHMLRFLNLAHTDDEAVHEIKLLKIDGIIWLLPHTAALGIIDSLKESGIPTVAVNRNLGRKDINCVKINTETYGYMGAKRLLEDGHRNIVYAARQEERESENEMYRGFKQAHKDFGIEYNESLALQAGNNLAYDFKKMFEFGVNFSAVMAHGTFLEHIISVIDEKKIRVPEDLTVLGDDMFLQIYSKPYFPRIVEPVNEVCHSASQMLLDILDKKQIKTVQKQIEPVIINN